MRLIKLLQRYPAWSIICLLAPFLFIGAIVILPTHDDWFSLVSPSQEPFFTKERFLFYGYHWRPFDSIFGYIVGLNHRLLFPTLNHISVIIGHICCTWLVYSISGLLRFNKTARNIATLFYFIAPATLATIFAVDGLNQTYSNLWGMAALFIYIKGIRIQEVPRVQGVQGVQGVTINTQHIKYSLFILFVIISTLCKENGISWAFITPIMAYGFNMCDRKILIRDFLLGIVIVITYAAAIILLPSNIIIEQEYVPTIGKIATNIIKYIFTSWITVDYVYLLHQPSMNIIIALITFILTVPFFYIILRRQEDRKKGRQDSPLFGRGVGGEAPKKVVLTLFVCQIIAVGPHLGTVFSMMHTYAGHCFTAFIIAYLINRIKTPLSMGKGLRVRLLWKAFALYIISALFIDIHIWYTSYESGIMGRDMITQIIEKTNGTPKRVRCINIADNYPKLSSFRVIPFEAIGWGYAIKYYTDYKWPETLVSEEINNFPTAFDEAKILARNYLKNNTCDCVWIINHQDITVINK